MPNRGEPYRSHSSRVDATLPTLLPRPPSMPETAPISKVSSSKRETIKVPLTAALVKSLDFAHWPVSPQQWDGSRLVTEPTPPGVKDWIVRDTVTRGLGVRVTPGSKSYFVQRKRKGSTSDRYVLTQQHSLQAARLQAADWYARMAAGENPTQTIKDRAKVEAEIRAAKHHTFGQAYDAFVTDGEERLKKKTLRPASVKSRAAVVNWMKDSKLWTTPLADVDVALAEETFAPIFASAQAAREARRMQPDAPKKKGGVKSDLAAAHMSLTHCIGAWNFAGGMKVSENPFSAWKKSTKLPKVPRRQSVLHTESDAGVAWLVGLNGLRASQDPVTAMIADYVLVAVLWGGRKSELAEIRWGDVNFAEDWACFAAETTKGNEDHYVPLTPWAHEILQSRRAKNEAAGWSVERHDRVFPHPATKTGKIEDYRSVTRQLKDETGLWIRLHDLRRTLAGSVFGSAMDLGTVSMALGHASDRDVTAGYVQRHVALASLRYLYIMRERNLRRLMKLDPEAAALNDLQRSIVESLRMTAKALLKQAGLDHLTPTEVADLLTEAP